MSARDNIAACACLAGLIALPHMLSYSQKELVVFLLINVLLAVSYRFLTLIGEWSLGHVVMMGVGAYGSAILAKRLGIPVLLSIPGGALIACGVAYLLSFPLFRMKGFYFLIGSFAAGEIIRLSWKRFHELFGGPKGIKSIPEIPSVETEFFTVHFYEPEPYYYLCLATVLVSIWLMRRIENSPMGLLFHAIHWRDKTAESVGINVRKYRTMVLVISSFFAGLAGALLAHYVGTVSPNRFNIEEMVFLLAWAIVGGTTTIYGPVIGVVVLTVINEVILRTLGLEQARPLFYGALLIIFVMFLPRGLESLPSQYRQWRQKKNDKSSANAA